MRRSAWGLWLVLALLCGSVAAQESKEIDEALAALREGDQRERSSAIALLGRVQTPASRAAVSAALRAATHDEDASLRGLAISSLVRVAGSEALDDCLRLLSDPDHYVRIYALNALGRTFPDPAPLPASCVPRVAAALERCDTDQQRELLQLLVRVRPLSASLPLLLERWRESSSCYFSASGQGHVELVQALRHEASPERRRVLQTWASQAFHQVGQRGVSAVPELVHLLRDERAAQRRLAAEWLTELGPGAAPALPGLVLLLEDERVEVRDAARAALGALGAEGAPAVGALIRDGERWDAYGAWNAVFRIGVQSRAAGRTLWWVPWRRYWGRLTLTALGLCGAWVLMAWLLRRVGHHPNLRYAIGTICAFGSAGVLGLAVLLWISSTAFLEPFLPQPPLALLPVGLSYSLSAFFLALLPGVWVYATFGRGTQEEVPWEDGAGGSAADQERA